MSVDNLDDGDPLPAQGVKEHNLCIRIDIEKIPPEEGCGKVHPSAETLVSHKMSPLLPGRFPTDRFWPEVAVAGRLVSDHPEQSCLSSRTVSFDVASASKSFSETWPCGGSCQGAASQVL